MEIRRFGAADWPALVEGSRRPYHDNYYAMYSSLYGGIVTDPALMLLPIDDHMVHRGDGIFETFKCVNGAIYNMGAHLDRLQQAVERLQHEQPAARADVEQIVIETVRAGGHRDCLVRLFVSRGPGSFGVSPFDCPEPQFYVAITSLKPPFMTLHPDGARVRTSLTPAKSAFLAGVKSCNYVTNVLMKKEAVEAGVDFVAAFDERGMLTEGSTENIGVVTADRRLLFPRLDGILCGTTMMRVMELARELQPDGLLADVAFADISKACLCASPEVLVVGTSPNVTAVTEFDGRPVGDGKPGPVFAALGGRLLKDIEKNEARLTRVFQADAEV